jgi:ubiquinone/menaquinone biosynthesis C-methylase UbiE
MNNNSQDKNQIAISTYEKIAEIYTNQYFNDLTDAPFIDIFLEKLNAGAKILDVGSGPGQFTQYMMKKGFEVLGIDYSKEMLKKAEQLVPEALFIYADMRKLDLESESFDGLLAAYSLIHIPSEELPHTLEGFFKVLKPGGYIQCIAQRGDADKIISEPFLPEEKMFFNFFTKERLSELLTTAGFEVDYQEEADSLDPDSASDSIIYSIARKPL